MKSNEEKVIEWVDQHYRLVYQYAYHICRDTSFAQRVADQTFMKAYEYLQDRRTIEDPGSWILTAARYYILREIYVIWENGTNVEEEFKLSGPIDMKRIREILTQYEESNADDKKGKR